MIYAIWIVVFARIPFLQIPLRKTSKKAPSQISDCQKRDEWKGFLSAAAAADKQKNRVDCSQKKCDAEQG
mgnify:CR=1 FL=1